MPKKRLLLFLFIILSLIFITYQSNKEPFQSLNVFNNMFNKLHEIKDSVKDSVTSPFRKMLLREEDNKKLRDEIAQLRTEQQRYHEAFLENRRLKKLLSLKDQEPRYVTAAAIIAKSTDQWSSIVTIDKGSSDGVRKNMTAITHRGLVGKISNVTDSYSYLLLLTDINFSSAARLQKSRVEGILSGTGFKKCKLKYIPYEEHVENGDTVITSGLDTLFPKGIPIGYISKIDKKGTGLFQEVEVIPFEDTTKTEEIVIIQRE
jgi:rod shape-determining protein MreC